MYTGNIGVVQGVGVLVEAASLLQDDPNIHIAVVGDGAAKAQIVAKAEGMALTNLTILPLQSQEDLPDLFASADLLLVSLIKGVTGHSVPSKTYTIMASGRPILASVEHDNMVRSLVEQVDCGYYAPPENPSALAAAIRQAAADPTDARKKGANGRRYVEAHFSAHYIAKQYHDILTDQVKNSGHT